MRLRELLWTTRALGLRHLFQLRRARDIGFVNIIRGHWTTRALTTLLNVGLLDEMAARGSVNLDQYATRHGLDTVILRDLCDYLFALRVFDKRGPEYALSSRGRFIYSTLRGLFESTYAYEDLIYNLEPLLRRELTWGKDIDRKTEFMARGSGTGGRLFAFPLVIKLIEERGLRRPLDLACGDAAFLRQLCQRNSTVAAYGVDIATDAIVEGRKRVSEDGFADRIQLFVEDIYQIERIADQLDGVDAITSLYGFQEFLTHGRDKLIGLLQHYRDIIPNAKFIICEVPRYSAEELRRRPGGILEYQLFHRLSHQTLATRAEWTAIWRDAGFRQIEEKYLDFARTVIYTLSW